MHTTFGPIALLGSGETSLAGGRVFETIARRLGAPLKIAILETPAGFELNSRQVAERVADFLSVRLQNYQPLIDIVPARKRGTAFSPDDLDVLRPLLTANLFFMGAGSPTYAVRQLSASLAWDIVRARHRMGAALVLASAATLAAGARVLPVYEVYKVGEEISCPVGLDLFADYGLALSCVPHWNNSDGGADVDTSRCFIGLERFQSWCGMHPPGYTILGLDEHTGIILDFAAGTFSIHGISSVTILRECQGELLPAGNDYPVSELGAVRCPEKPEQGIPANIWDLVQTAAQGEPEAPTPPEAVLNLLEERRQARASRDWRRADDIRDGIAALGWKVIDTGDGQRVEKA